MAFESGVDDGFHDGWIVELLGFVDFMASWHAAGVVVGEVRVIAFDGCDDIAFHDLHVVDIVEELEIFRAHGLAEFHAPGAGIALVIRVIYAAIEQFHDQGDPVFFREGQGFFKAFCAYFEAIIIAQAVAIAGEDDDMSGAEVGGFFDVAFQSGGQSLVIFAAVKAFFDTAEFGVSGAFDADAADHGAGEIEFFQGGKVIDADEVDRRQPHFFAGAAEVLERDAFVAPLADRMVDMAFQSGGGVGGLDAMGEAGGGESGGRSLEKRSAGAGGG